MKIIMFLFANFLRRDFIIYKHRFNLHEKVQVHHIIPLEWKTHINIINSQYDIDSGYNLILMPTKMGKLTINTSRRIHDGGHPKYNKYVYSLLDKNEDPFEINKILRKKIINDEEIPW